MPAPLGPTHDTVARGVYNSIRRKTKDLRRAGHCYAVESERQYPAPDDGLPSGKTFCRPDVVCETPFHDWAFEVKMSKSDLQNASEQVEDYEALGLRPVVVCPAELFWNIEHDDIPSLYSVVVYRSKHAFVDYIPSGLGCLVGKHGWWLLPSDDAHSYPYDDQYLP